MILIKQGTTLKHQYTGTVKGQYCDFFKKFYSIIIHFDYMKCTIIECLLQKFLLGAFKSKNENHLTYVVHVLKTVIGAEHVEEYMYSQLSALT